MLYNFSRGRHAAYASLISLHVSMSAPGNRRINEKEKP